MSDHEAATYDGLPIAREKPYLACIIVYRVMDAAREVLILHRAQHGADYEGDWAWTPPAGARLPGEDILACAHRELREETGLALSLRPAPGVTEDCAVFVARAGPDRAIVLDAEHDRYEWVSVQTAMNRCLPAVVAEEIRAAMDLIDR